MVRYGIARIRWSDNGRLVSRRVPPDEIKPAAVSGRRKSSEKHEMFGTISTLETTSFWPLDFWQKFLIIVKMITYIWTHFWEWGWHFEMNMNHGKVNPSNHVENRSDLANYLKFT